MKLIIYFPETGFTIFVMFQIHEEKMAAGVGLYEI